MSQIASPPPPGLIELGVRPSIRRYLRELWERRDFATENAVGQMRAEHMDTTLGNAWHLLNPSLLIAVYYLVFGVLLHVTRGIDNLIGFLAVGIFVYHWATKAITGGARAIVSNEGLIRSLQFPRALLPISTVMQETLGFLPGVVVMAAVMLLTGEGVTPSWLLILPVFVLQFVFCLGAAFVTARAADKFRDTLNLLPFVFRLVFYGSGVLYAVDDRFHSAFEHAWVVWLFLANPFYCFISLWRNALMSTQDIQRIPVMWVSATAWAAFALLIGTLIVRAGETEYGRG